VLNVVNMNKILIKLKGKIESNQGLIVFGQNKAKFEDWIKVELCGILGKYDGKIIPEKDDIDITSNKLEIELKIFVTNGTYEEVEDVPSKNVTENRNGIIKDFVDLKKRHGKERAVIFIVFPVSGESDNWVKHRLAIEDRIGKELPKPIEFTFKDTKINGLIYYVLVE